MSLAMTAPQSVQLVLPEWRCAKCGRLLFKAILQPGTQIETKCKHCNTFCVVSVALPEGK